MLMYEKNQIYDGLELIPWNSWTPTVSSATGSIGSATVQHALYKVVGGLLFYDVNVKINSKGTAGGDYRISTPPGYSVVNRAIGSGRETDITGTLLQVLCVSSLLVVLQYNNVIPSPASPRLIFDGFYEIA